MYSRGVDDRGDPERGWDIRLVLMDEAPEPICQKMFEGQPIEPKVEVGLGLGSMDCQIAGVPATMPAQWEFLVVRICVTAGFIY